MTCETIYHTPDGFDDIILTADGGVLTGLWFVGFVETHGRASLPQSSQKSSSQQQSSQIPSSPQPPPTVIRETCRWLDIYFSGRQPGFTPVFQMDNLTPFRKRVLDMVCTIPWGETMTYGEIAKRLGTRSAQAVGGAVGWNPICLIVPCHRVMGANGSLTGYGGGLRNKAALLRLEGAI